MLKFHHLFLPLLLLIMACGPSKEEIAAREKFVADSLQVIADSMEAARADSIASAKAAAEALRVHTERIEVGKSMKRTQLTNLLDEAKQELAREKRALNNILEFKFGRSAATKRSQLKRQREKIQEIELWIPALEREVAMASLFNSFDFQATPVGVVEHLFSSAKSGDYSKLRHLMDPYGEYEQEAQRLCLVEVTPYDEQQRWKSTFENGRIMGEPEFMEDRAAIEVAIGPTSSRLVTIELVQRMDRWYIVGL